MRPKSKSVLVKGAEEVSHETETFAAYPADDGETTGNSAMRYDYLFSVSTR